MPKCNTIWPKVYRVNEEQEEFARHKAYKRHKEVYRIQGHHTDVHSANIFRKFVSTQVKTTAKCLTIRVEERMYIVDSGASSHLVGFLSVKTKEKKTSRWSSKNLDIQSANGIVVPDTQAKVYINELRAFLWFTCGGRFTVSAILEKTMQWARLLSVAVQANSHMIKMGESDRMQHRKLSPRSSSYQTKSCTIYRILVGQRKLWARRRSGGHHVGSVKAFHGRIESRRCLFLDFKKLVSDFLHLIKEQLLEDKPPSEVTDPERDTLGKRDQELRKESLVSNQEEIAMCPLIIRKSPIVKSVRRQKQHEPGVE